MAIPHFQIALGVTPNDVVVNTNFGLCLLATGRYLAAANQFEKALDNKPDHLTARINLGTALSKVSGREADAIKQFEEALKLSPEMPRAHHELAMLLLELGRRREAISHLEAEERIYPSPEVSRLLADLRARRD